MALSVVVSTDAVDGGDDSDVVVRVRPAALLAQQEESDFLDPLREQLGYLASAKEVHRGRGRALDALQVSVGV